MRDGRPRPRIGRHYWRQTPERGAADASSSIRFRGPDASTPHATGLDVTVTGDVSGLPIITITDAGVSALWCTRERRLSVWPTRPRSMPPTAHQSLTAFRSPLSESRSRLRRAVQQNHGKVPRLCRLTLAPTTPT